MVQERTEADKSSHVRLFHRTGKGKTNAEALTAYRKVLQVDSKAPMKKGPTSGKRLRSI